jgi:hypothetical protein
LALVALPSGTDDPTGALAVQAARTDKPVKPQKKQRAADSHEASPPPLYDAPQRQRRCHALRCLQVERHDAAAAGAATGCRPESGPCGGSAVAVGGSPPAFASGESASAVGAAAVEGGNVKLRDTARSGDLAAV